MSWSRYHIVHPEEAFAAGVPVTKVSDSSFIAQRAWHADDGVLEVKMTPVPATVTGSVIVQGKLSEDAPWADLYFRNGNLIELVGKGPTPVSGLVSFGFGGIPVVHAMRVRFEAFTPSALTTVSVRMME